MRMSGTLALLISGGVGNWKPERWKQEFESALPGRRVAVLPRDEIDPAEVAYAAVWKPAEGALLHFPNLKVVFNLGAGVDALFAKSELLPKVPIVRAVSNDLTGRMSEYVLLHVLWYHRQQRLFDDAQKRHQWVAPDQWAAPALRVGIMGLGVLGQDAARKLRTVGFDVAGWSRSRKEIAGIRSFAGEDELPAFLARTDVLVVLLPLTKDTRGIVNRKLLGFLARDGVLGGPVLINAGRGGLQVESDILEALDDGTLIGATLDVFNTEPLSPDSPFWAHRKVRITPHNAADSDPAMLSRDVASQILAFERGEALRHVVKAEAEY